MQHLASAEANSVEQPVEVAVIVLVVIGLALALALVWRPFSGRKKTAEEALDAEDLRREQEKVITDAKNLADRYNIPGRRR